MVGFENYLYDTVHMVIMPICINFLYKAPKFVRSPNYQILFHK